MKKSRFSRFIVVVVVLILAAVIYFWHDIWGIWQFTQAMDKEQTVAEQRGVRPFALAQACIQCHGQHGNSQHPFYPRLAGQSEEYLLAQLEAFADGRRHDPMMQPFALALSKEERLDLARYFSRSELTPIQKEPSNPQIADTGRKLVTACFACHGAALEGNLLDLENKKIAIPRLAGQSSDYLVRQLKAFRDGSRADPSGSMIGIARGLSDQDITLIAQYLYHL